MLSSRNLSTISSGTRSHPRRGVGVLYNKAKLRYRKGGDLLPPLPHWINPNMIKWIPLIQVSKKPNKFVGILLGMSCGEVDDTFTPSTHVITLVKMTGSYWSNLSDTLTVRGQRKTLSGASSGEATTTYCSTLVYTRLLSWSKNYRNLRYQYSKSISSK